MSHQLPAELFRKLKENNVDKLTVTLTGGNDEAIVDCDFQPWPKAYTSEIETLIDDWIYSSFNFSGAGDGTEYGTHYVYDLNAGTCYSQDFYTEIKLEPQTDPEAFTVVDNKSDD